MKKDILIVLLLSLVYTGIPTIICAQSFDVMTARDLTMLSFDDLMHVEVKSATFTGVERIKTPASITTITKEEIQATPHRNLLDLLEVYVPSATYVNHWLGPRLGIRGVVSDQNYSYLLLVNGENMNLQTENGPMFEIQNKDLADVEKIEIIRGPGSVVHGPGAIGGVISITTKEPATADRASVSLTRDFTYRFSTLNASYSVKKKQVSAYMFGSITQSEGIKDPQFYYIDRAHGYGYGYMSDTWGNKGKGTPAPHFYADFQDRPEVKLHLSLDLFKEFTFFARYTNFSFIKQQQQTGALDGPAFPGIYGQQLTSSLQNNHVLNEQLKLVTSLGFQSQSTGDVTLYQSVNKPFDDITQRRTSYAENKINFRSIMSYHPSNQLKLALGCEYNYWYYSPEWGKEKSSLVMDFAPPVKFAVIDTTSGFYAQYNPNGIVTPIYTTIEAHQISAFFEANYQPTERTTLLVSGRFDKHNMADFAFSPRIALVHQLNKNNVLKMIAQQSVRLPGFRELYAFDYAYGNASAPEKLQGVELVYTRIQSQNFTMNASVFYQSIDQIGWTSNNTSDLIGTFQTAGVNADVSYKVKDFNVSLSYSYIQQLGWSPAFDFESYLTNIGADSSKVILVNAGENRINNVPQHQLKLVSSYAINTHWYFHFDSRLASRYGQLEMLDEFKTVHDNFGTDITKNEMAAIFADLDDKGYGKTSLTSNMSVRYNWSMNNVDMSLSLWSMNLLSVNNVRYVHQFWEAGNNRQYPRQVGFVKEPRTVGLALNAKF